MERLRQTALDDPVLEGRSTSEPTRDNRDLDLCHGYVTCF